MLLLLCCCCVVVVNLVVVVVVVVVVVKLVVFVVFVLAWQHGRYGCRRARGVIRCLQQPQGPHNLCLLNGLLFHLLLLSLHLFPH